MADLPSQPTDASDETPDTSGTEESVRDLSVMDTSATEEPAPPVPVAARPANDDLLGELARAMHAAATSQYERMNAELERCRTEQVEAIESRASAEAEQLESTTETDIGAIDAWAKAETEKIKRERLRRIDARREQLAAQLERQATIRQREVFAIEVAIDAHRSEIDQFFGRMERETDPAAIAQVASSLPAFPSLEAVAEEARRGALAEFAGLEAEAGSALPPNAADVLAADGAAAGGAAPDEAPSEVLVSETRLRAVMDLDAAQTGSPGGTPSWEAPSVVSVAAGPGTETAPEAEAHNRGGTTLLRTVRAIRPMAGYDRADADR